MVFELLLQRRDLLVGGRVFHLHCCDKRPMEPFVTELTRYYWQCMPVFQWLTDDVCCLCSFNLQPIRNLINKTTGSDTSLLNKVLAGTLSGAISSSLCNPTDLIKIRMQADSGVPRYRGIAHAFVEIVKNEGVLALYNGVGPTCARASLGAATELATWEKQIHHQ